MRRLYSLKLLAAYAAGAISLACVIATEFVQKPYVVILMNVAFFGMVVFLALLKHHAGQIHNNFSRRQTSAQKNALNSLYGLGAVALAAVWFFVSVLATPNFDPATRALITFLPAIALALIGFVIFLVQGMIALLKLAGVIDKGPLHD